MTIGKTPHNADPTFFVFDIPIGFHPLLIGKIDNANSTADGLNAVAVAEDTTNHKIYAYVANNSPANQLQVIDVTDPDSITPEKIVDFDLDNVGGTQGIGNSIFLKTAIFILDCKQLVSMKMEIAMVQNFILLMLILTVRIRQKLQAEVIIQLVMRLMQFQFAANMRI